MDWINTPESSSISRFAYDEASRVLEVEFANGSVYDYFDVPDHVFDGMRNASSKGQYLAQQVKGNFRYARA
jgi:YD repeat-containing protein